MRGIIITRHVQKLILVVNNYGQSCNEFQKLGWAPQTQAKPNVATPAYGDTPRTLTL